MKLIMSIAACFLLVVAHPLNAADYAFIVGVGGYNESQLKSLGKFPRNDAIELRKVLLNNGYNKQNIVLMVDDFTALPRTNPVGRYLPESSKIKKELRLLLGSLEPSDSIVIAFAGHGVQFKGDVESFFCPLDSKLTDRSTLLSLNWLYKELEYNKKTDRGCKSRRKLLLVDACRNDPSTATFRSSSNVDLESVTLPQEIPAPEGVVALFSCAPNQQAVQHEKLGHGVFFHHVLEGLRGQADLDNDSNVTLDEVITFTKSSTTSYARTNLGVLQTPRQKGYFEGTWTLANFSYYDLPAKQSGEGDKPLIATKAYLQYDKLPPGGKCKVLLRVSVRKGWTIHSNPPMPDYMIPTEFKIKSNHEITLVKVDYPKGRLYRIDGLNERMRIYAGEFSIWGVLNIPESASGKTAKITMTLHYQANDDSKCLPPAKVVLNGSILVAKPGETIKTVNTSLFKKYSSMNIE